MTVGIITAMELELENIVAAMEGKTEINTRMLRFFKGTVAGKEVIACNSGIGKVNSALCCQIMIDCFSPGAILMTGVAGGLSESLRHMDIVVPDRFSYHDLDNVMYGRYLPYRTSFEADPKLSELFRKSAGRCFSGTIASGDLFVDTAEQKKAIKEKCSAVCVDMETGAVAHTCYLNGVPFAAMKVIADFADEDAVSDDVSFERKAADKAAGILLKTVKEA